MKSQVSKPHSTMNTVVNTIRSTVMIMVMMIIIKIMFTIIMITRQMISMGVSTVLFGHQLKPISLIGAVVVFSCLFYRARRNYRASQQKKKPTAVVPDKEPLMKLQPTCNQSFNFSLQDAEGKGHIRGSASPGAR